MRPIKPVTIPVTEDQPQPVKASLKSLEGDLDIMVDSINKSVTDLNTGLAGTVTHATVSTLPNHADDTAAATGGIAVGGMYRTGSIIKVRVA